MTVGISPGALRGQQWPEYSDGTSTQNRDLVGAPATSTARRVKSNERDVDLELDLAYA